MPQKYHTIIGHHSYVTPKFLHFYTSRFLVLAIQLYTLLVVFMFVYHTNFIFVGNGAIPKLFLCLWYT